MADHKHLSRSRYAALIAAARTLLEQRPNEPQDRSTQLKLLRVRETLRGTTL